MQGKRRYLIFILLVVIFLSLILPGNLSAETMSYWVDTSHWETKSEWVGEGHNETISGQRWIDTSYVVHRGHWEEYIYYVDVEYREWTHRDVYRYVDTSHYERRYRYVQRFVSYGGVVYVGTNAYGWSVYRFAAHRVPGIFSKIINGTTYLYTKEVIDYRPARGGHVYAEKHTYIARSELVREEYLVWVNSGQWGWVSEWYWRSFTVREPRTGQRWIDTSYTVNRGYWETYTERVWIDTSYTVNRGYWENYTETVWVDTSHWNVTSTWVQEGHWVEADISMEGKVLHTMEWNENRIQYNLSKGGDEDNPRPYEVFFNGEKFVLNATATGEFEPESISVEFIDSGFSTELSNRGGGKWEGELWDISFMNLHDTECSFLFTANYDGGVEIEDEVVVYIVRDNYWRLRRLF